MQVKGCVLVCSAALLAGFFWYLGKKTAQYCTAAYLGERESAPQISRPADAAFFSEMAQGTFPGLKLRDTDFLVPLNRLVFTGYAEIDDPKGDYGTAGIPGNVMVFGIAEEGNIHSFMVWGTQERTVEEHGELKYLGKNIVVEKAGRGEDGAYQVHYKDGETRKQNRCSMRAFYAGPCTEPDPDIGTAVKLTMDKRAHMTDKVNPRYFDDVSIETMFERFQEAVRRDDRKTVVEYFKYPIVVDNESYFTRKELLAFYDKLFTERRKEEILNGSAKDIFKRGGAYCQLPGGFFCHNTLHDAVPIDLVHRR